MSKIAVIGAGYWGKNLVRVFHELGVLKTICDKDKETLVSFSQKYPLVEVTQEVNDIFSDKEIAAVVIATPAVTHYDLAKRSLLSGKHVFVEKPLALDIKEGAELSELSKKHNKVFMVGHILNYHSALIKLQELIDKGELGRIEYIYSNRLNIGKLRKEENILWSFAPHDISVILMLLHELPTRVRSFGGAYLQKDIYDTTLTTLVFPSGVRAHIFVSWLHPFKEQKLVVVGNKKMAVFNDMAENKLLLYPHKIEWQNRVPIAQKAEAEIIAIEKTEPLKAEATHFLECIEKKLAPKTDAREAFEVLRVLTASEESLGHDGKPVVLQDVKDSGNGYFVHSSSVVDDGVIIGEGTQIWHFSHILKGSSLGKNCKIGQNVVIGPNAIIGNGCKIQNNVSIYEGITLEDNVFCGPSCVFTNVFNPRSEIPRMSELRDTLIRKGATIGANATIVCGNMLGRYSFVGAGSVVTKDVPDYALVYGNPAKLSGWMCECGVKLDFRKSKTTCANCKKEYRRNKDKIERIR